MHGTARAGHEIRNITWKRGRAPTPILVALLRKWPVLLRTDFVRAALLQDPSLLILPQNCPSQGQFGSLERTKSALSKEQAIFLLRPKVWGLGPSLLFQNKMLLAGTPPPGGGVATLIVFIHPTAAGSVEERRLMPTSNTRNRRISASPAGRLPARSSSTDHDFTVVPSPPTGRYHPGQNYYKRIP